MSRGLYLPVSDDTRTAFNSWYQTQDKREQSPVIIQPEKINNNNNNDYTSSTSSTTNTTTATTTNNQSTNFVVTNVRSMSDQTSSIANKYPALRKELNNSFYKTRNRTSFDPELEIPRLQKWFDTESHPSRVQMSSYVDELNNLPTRLGKKLDISNIIYWFKNARAAYRRAKSKNSLESSSLFDTQGDAVVIHMVEPDGDLSDERLSPGFDDEIPPILPNRNAVYMLNNPLFNSSSTTLPGVDDNSPVISICPQEPMDETTNDDDDEDEDGGGRLQIVEEDEGTNGDLIISEDHDLMKDDYVVVSAKKGTKRLKVDGVKQEIESDTEVVTPITKPSTTKVRAILPSQPTHVALASPLSMHYLNPVAHALYGLTPPNQQGNSPLTGASLSPVLYSEVNDADRKKRSRVFIDPVSEIPRLEQWFDEDTHPSAYMIERYTNILNGSDYRQRFPPLESKNVQLWFKNHRAKVKRSKVE